MFFFFLEGGGASVRAGALNRSSTVFAGRER